MIALIAKIAHRLWLLWYGDDALRDRLEVTNVVLADCRKGHIATLARLTSAQGGLSRIAEHAEHASRNGQPEVFLTALRDYAIQVRESTSGRSSWQSFNTDGVSAAARWGFDFDAPPREQAPKRVTY